MRLGQEDWRKWHVRYLTNCNYPEKLIDDSIKKALTLNRTELIKSVPSNTRDSNLTSIVHVSTFHSNCSSNTEVLHWKTIQPAKFSKQKKILLSKRQPPNLNSLFKSNRSVQTMQLCSVEHCSKAVLLLLAHSGLSRRGDSCSDCIIVPHGRQCSSGSRTFHFILTFYFDQHNDWIFLNLVVVIKLLSQM